MSLTPARRRRLAWTVGIAMLTVLLALALRGVDWVRAIATMTRASPAWVAAGIAANFLILALSTWQWKLLLPPGRHVSVGRMFRIRSITSTVANGGPFLGGYAATVHLLATWGGVGYEAGVSLKAVEQVTEGLAKLALLAAALLLAPLPASLQGGAVALLVAVPALAALLLVSSGSARDLERWAAEREGSGARIVGFAGEVAKELTAMRRWQTFGGATVLALAQKAAEGLGIAAVAASLGVSLGISGVVLTLVAVNLSTMISVTPANAGIYEASAFLALRVSNVDPANALGLSVLLHLAYLIPLAGTGWVLLAAGGPETRSPP